MSLFRVASFRKQVLLRTRPPLMWAWYHRPGFFDKLTLLRRPRMNWINEKVSHRPDWWCLLTYSYFDFDFFVFVFVVESQFPGNVSTTFRCHETCQKTINPFCYDDFFQQNEWLLKIGGHWNSLVFTSRSPGFESNPMTQKDCYKWCHKGTSHRAS